LRHVPSDLAERVAAVSPDILVEDELSHPALLRAGRRLRQARPTLTRVGLVHHLRSSEPRGLPANAFYRWIERHYLAALDAFIFNSRTTRAAVQRLGLPVTPSIVAVPGADRLAISIDGEAIQSRAQARALAVIFLGTLIHARASFRSRSRGFALTGLSQAHGCWLDGRRPGYARRVRHRVEQLRLRPCPLKAPSIGGAASAMVEARSGVLRRMGWGWLSGRMGCGLPHRRDRGGASRIHPPHLERVADRPGRSAGLGRPPGGAPAPMRPPGPHGPGRLGTYLFTRGRTQGR
jgi:hypothetical protein